MKLNEVAKEPEFTGALAKFDKWYNKKDLWHPAFPDRWADCVSDYLPDADYETLEDMGLWMADNLTSCYADKVKLFIDYAKQHPIPDKDYEDEAAHEKAIEAYCQAALDAMYPQQPKAE